MPRANLPEDILRLLSFHGPVELWTGEGEGATTGRVDLAPFDEELILFVPMGSPLQEGLRQCSRAQVSAKKEDRSYTLRLWGRAAAGRPVSAHPRRASLQAWLPEGARPERLLAVPFVALEVELVREQGIERTRFAGPTPAGKAEGHALRRWASVGLGGGARVGALVGGIASFLWFGYLGADHPLRPLAVALAWVAVLGLAGGVQLLGLASAFGNWLQGRGSARLLTPLIEGRLAPGEARRGGLALLVAAGLALGGLLAFPRGGASALIVVLASGAPLLAAHWATRALLAGRGGDGA